MGVFEEKLAALPLTINAVRSFEIAALADALRTSSPRIVYPCSDLGFNSWMMQHILPVGRPLPGSPVAIGDRCLTVRLPSDLTAREFDKQLAASMSGARLNGWLDTADGRKHCAILGVDPTQFKRGTTYRFNSGMRRSDDAEIYFFRPKTDDADRLLRLAEAIVHQHVMTPPARRAIVSWRSRSQGTRSDFEPAFARQGKVIS